MNYPEKMLRGISNPEWIDANGYATSAAFQFSPNPDRKEGIEFEEASINWYDDENALKLLLDQRKENSDSAQFKGGVAILSRKTIDFFADTPYGKGNLSYERRPVPGNNYHGNLLRGATISKQLKSIISAAIAMSVEKILPAYGNAR
jgi:hypothetical protein